MFRLHLSVDHFHYYIGISVLKRKCRITLFTFNILNILNILNALRTDRIESESISFRKHWYFLEMLSSEMILKKEPLKISHNSVSLEMFLPFSVRLVFSPFKGLFVKRCIIVFQKVLLSVTFLCPDYCSMIFL